MDSTHYCQQLATPPGSNLYYALLFHEPAERKKLLGLFALHLELQRTVQECQDPGVARVKLQWWQEEIERLYSGQSRHPVGKILSDVMEKNELGQGKLQQLVRTTEASINPPANNSLRELIDNYSRSHAPTWQLASSIIGHSCDSNLASLAGLYAGVEALKTTLPILNRGYCIIPSDLMQKHALNAEDLRCEPSAQKNQVLMTDLFSQMQSKIDEVLKQLLENPTYPPLFASSLVGIARANCGVMKNKSDLRALPTTSITPLRKLWISWKARRH